jgi:hypothetical protein
MLKRNRQKQQEIAFRKQLLEDECAERMVMGAKKYGKFNPKTNKRDLLQDIREEAADIINYSRMHRMKQKNFTYLLEHLAVEIYLETFDLA